MQRRDFITLLGSAAASSLAWPPSGRAQQPALPVIGYIGSSSAAVNVKRVAAFRKGLPDTGFVDGRNVAIEFPSPRGPDDPRPPVVAPPIPPPPAPPPPPPPT